MVPLWLGLVAVIVSARTEHKSRVDELLSQKHQLIQATASYNQQIAQYRQQVIELVRAAVKKALAPLHDSQDASKLLIEVSEQVIRPLSHDLAITELEIQTNQDSSIKAAGRNTAPGQILNNMRTEAAFPVGFLPYLFMLTALPSFLAVAGLVSTAVTFALIAVFIIGGFPLLDKITHKYRTNLFWFGWVLVIASWVFVSLAVGYGVHLLMHDVPKLAAAGYSSVVIIFVGTLLSSILKATLIE